VIMTFNRTNKGLNKTINFEGELAYKLDKETELYVVASSSLLSDKFYLSALEILTKMQILVSECNPEFVAKLAVYVREKMYLRSVPVVLAVELAKYCNKNSLVSKTVERIVQRADEITEFLGYYQIANKRDGVKKLNHLSKQLQKGLAGAFNKFDEYQFAKYNKQDEIKFRDALFLVHPKAKNENQQEIFNKIVNNCLSVPYTWETEFSEIGKTAGKYKNLFFKQKWQELIDSKRLPYMAMLRNMRNFLDNHVSLKHIDLVAKLLADKTQGSKSKQLPFRYLSAFKELQDSKSLNTKTLLNALEEAVLNSVGNLKGFDNETTMLIACDFSGSMDIPISENSKIKNYEIGILLGMLLQSKAKLVITGIFGETWKIINMPDKNILANTDAISRRKGEVGHSTNGYLVIEDMINRKIIVDKIMFFTDCQLWNSIGNNKSISKLWVDYKKINPKAKIYLIDLVGYGSAPLNVKSNDVFLISGFSDKIFDMLYAIENNQSVISEINKIEI